jgi:hypothetical protein
LSLSLVTSVMNNLDSIIDYRIKPAAVGNRVVNNSGPLSILPFRFVLKVHFSLI